MNMPLKVVAPVVVALLVAVAVPAAQAGDPYDVLPQGRQFRHQPQCSHVIELMMRNTFTGGKLAPAVMHTPYGPRLIQPEVGDLELCSVQLVCEATAECGPKFAVTFTNHSKHDVEGFHISLTAVLCHIDPFDPTTTVKVECLKAGETATLEIALPITAMAMQTEDARLAEFDTLVVALDAYDEYLECDECNNVQVLKRGEIEAVVIEEQAALEAPADAPTEGGQPGTEPGTAPGTVPGEQLPEAELPGNPAKPSPLDDLDLDQIQLEGEAEDEAEAGFRW